MTRRPPLRKVIWTIDCYSSMARTLQEIAYRLTELREEWKVSIEELSGASFLSVEIIQRFEELGADSLGKRLRDAGHVEAKPDHEGERKDLADFAERYKSLAHLVQEAAHELKGMREDWGMLSTVISRACGVDHNLIERAERIGEAGSIVLARRKAKSPQERREMR